MLQSQNPDCLLNSQEMSKLPGCIIIFFSGLKRNTNHSLHYQNTEKYFTLSRTRLLQTDRVGVKEDEHLSEESFSATERDTDNRRHT